MFDPRPAPRATNKRPRIAARPFHWNGGGATRSRTGLYGFAIRCITALLSRRYLCVADLLEKMGSTRLPIHSSSGAGEESRTLDLNLGKVALYQLSYSRVSLQIVS